MKYILVVGDGMADEKIASLGGKTPLEAAAGSHLARIAGGETGRIRTCPPEFAPGSDVAFLTLLGHDPVKCYRGRSPLEAAGEEVALKENEVSFRMNLATIDGSYEGGVMASYNGDGIDGADAYRLASDLVSNPEFAALMDKAHMHITVTDTFRHIAVVDADDEPFDLTPPHDIAGRVIDAYQPKGQKADLLRALQKTAHRVLSAHPINQKRIAEGRLPANAVWFWGAGRATILDNFTEQFGKTGTAVSAVPLVRGIAWLSGLKAPRIPVATGALETNYEGKVAAALDALKSGDDFVLLHLEAPDDLSHLGDLEGKVESIRRLDERLIAPVMDALDKSGEDYRMLVMPDHYTLLSTRTHDATPVPYAIYDSRHAGTPRLFCEAGCAECPVITSGVTLLNQLFELGE